MTLVHLANAAARVGATLTFDPKTETVTNNTAANDLMGRKYRNDHWAVPKRVG